MFVGSYLRPWAKGRGLQQQAGRFFFFLFAGLNIVGPWARGLEQADEVVIIGFTFSRIVGPWPGGLHQAGGVFMHGFMFVGLSVRGPKGLHQAGGIVICGVGGLRRSACAFVVCAFRRSGGAEHGKPTLGVQGGGVVFYSALSFIFKLLVGYGSMQVSIS